MHPKRLESRILKAMNRATRDFGLIEAGDRILVGMSGGKDSYALLWGLMKMRAAAAFEFGLVPYHLDQGQPDHEPEPLEEHLRATGLTYEIEYQDTYTRVLAGTAPGKIYCSLCSRFRRAILYKAAIRHDCNKVALGHHADDLIETLLLSIFYSGQIKSMPAKLKSDAGEHELIRPLVYVPETELRLLAEQKEFAILPCNLCGSLQSQRQFIKGMLSQLQERSPHIKGNILNSLGNVKHTHLLDRDLYPYLDGASDADEGEDLDRPHNDAGPLPILPSDLF